MAAVVDDFDIVCPQFSQRLWPNGTHGLTWEQRIADIKAWVEASPFNIAHHTTIKTLVRYVCFHIANVDTPRARDLMRQLIAVSCRAQSPVSSWIMGELINVMRQSEQERHVVAAAAQQAVLCMTMAGAVSALCPTSSNPRPLFEVTCAALRFHDILYVQQLLSLVVHANSLGLCPGKEMGSCTDPTALEDAKAEMRDVDDDALAYVNEVFQ